MSNLREERLEYILRYLANKVEWCVNPEMLSRATVDYARADEAINEAKQAIIDWHNKQVVGELKNYTDWVQQLHAEPEDSSDRWSAAAMEIVAEGRERINKLKESR